MLTRQIISFLLPLESNAIHIRSTHCCNAAFMILYTFDDKLYETMSNKTNKQALSMKTFLRPSFAHWNTRMSVIYTRHNSWHIAGANFLKNAETRAFWSTNTSDEIQSLKSCQIDTIVEFCSLLAKKTCKCIITT